MNALRTSLIAAAFVGMVLIISVPNAGAQNLEEGIRVTFSGPVELPGEVLPAGAYVFEALDNGHVTRVLSADRSHVVATMITVPEELLAPPDKATVILRESPSGVPERVDAWFYPGDSIGQEFMYRRNVGR